MRAVFHALPFAILFAALVSTAPVNAADQPKPQQAETPKEPPPPLFPKHRRGIYKDNSGLEVVDATPKSRSEASLGPQPPDPNRPTLATHARMPASARLTALRAPSACH